MGGSLNRGPKETPIYYEPFHNDSQKGDPECLEIAIFVVIRTERPPQLVKRMD